MSKDLATDRQTATNKSNKPRSTSPIPRQIVNKICTTCNGTGNIPSDAHVGGSMECASCLGRGWNYRYKADGSGCGNGGGDVYGDGSGNGGT